MKSGRIISGLVIGAVVALIIIPKTRKMLSDAVCQITDSLKETLENANDMAQKEQKEVTKLADKTKNVADAVKSTKETWQ